MHLPRVVNFGLAAAAVLLPALLVAWARATEPVVNAPTWRSPPVGGAMTLAAIPTLLVFILAQNTIMKGIIIPSYK